MTRKLLLFVLLMIVFSVGQPAHAEGQNGLLAHYEFNNSFADSTNNGVVTIADTRYLKLANGRLSLENNHDGDPKKQIQLNLDTTSLQTLKIESFARYIARGNYTLSGIYLYDNRNDRRNSDVLCVAHNNYHGPTNNFNAVNSREHVYLVDGRTANGKVAGFNQSGLLPLSFGREIKETIVIDYQQNKANYYREYLDGSPGDHQTLDLAYFKKSKDTCIMFVAWDWANGSQVLIDSIKVYTNGNGMVSNDHKDGTTVEEGQVGNTTGNSLNSCVIGESSPGPFNIQNGNFTHTQTDLLIKSRGIPLEVSRYYNNKDLFDGPFGHGWNMNYTALMSLIEEDGVRYAVVHMGNGIRLRFREIGDGVFEKPVGKKDTLVQNPDGTFSLNGGCNSCSRQALPEYRFHSDGSLQLIRDMNGNTVTVQYNQNGRIKSATDANGRSIAFTYGDNGRVSKMTDFSSRVWNYAYDGYENLTSVVFPDGGSIKYRYDEDHNLVEILDEQDRSVTAMVYGKDHKLESFTDKGGMYKINYDPVQRITEKTDPEGKIFRFAYDQNGNVINKSTPEGLNLKLTWDAGINVSGKENSMGIKTAYDYDDQGNLTRVVKDAVTGGFNYATDYEYDSRFNKISQIKDPRNNITRIIYDDFGNILRQEAPIGSAEYEYDSHGNVIRTTDPDGYITVMEYDDNGYLTRVFTPGTEPLLETVMTYDERGNLLTRKDAAGHTTVYLYDSMDRMIRVTDPLGNVTQYEYDLSGHPKTITDPEGNRTKFEYDRYGQLLKRIDAWETPGYQRETTYTYDLRGNLKTVTDPMGRTRTYVYDERSRLTSLKNQAGQEWRFAYDLLGNLVSKTDPNGNSTTFAYDAVNRLKSVTDAENHTTTYDYDAGGNLLSIVDANTHKAVANTYDANGRLVSSRDALDFGENYIYSDGGKLTQKTDADGRITAYSYHPVTGRLEKISYQGGREETYTYDNAGRILSVQDNETGITLSFTYDANGNLLTETWDGITVVSYGYDGNGRRTTMDVTGKGQFKYTWDPLNRLTSVENPLGQNTFWEYHANDLRKKAIYANGVTTDYVHDQADRLESILHKNMEGIVIAGCSYTYDNMNNRLSETDHTGLAISYTYDRTYKLLSAVYPDETVTYTYDGVGNRKTKTDLTGTISYIYDAADRLLTCTGPDAATVSFTYDKSGNTLAKTDGTGVTNYMYDLKFLLRKIVYPDASENHYTYDPLGRRSSAVDSKGTWRFIYDGKNVLADLNQTTPAENILYTYSLGLDDIISSHVGDMASPSTNLYLKDGLNSVRKIVDIASGQTAVYGYYPYGNIKLEENGLSGQNLAGGFTYTGRRAEPDSGLMYYRSRYYNPETGRFMKKDRYKGKLEDPLSLNRFGYVHGNPVNFVDPEGLKVEWGQTFKGGGEFLFGLVDTGAGIYTGNGAAISVGMSGMFKGLGDFKAGLRGERTDYYSGYEALALIAYQELFTDNPTKEGQDCARDVGKVFELGVTVYSLKGAVSSLKSVKHVSKNPKAWTWYTNSRTWFQGGGTYMNKAMGALSVFSMGTTSTSAAYSVKDLQKEITNKVKNCVCAAE